MAASKEQTERVSKARQTAVDTIVEMMEKEGLSWVKEWDSIDGMPFNAASGRKYSGSNVFLLMAASLAYEYNDPRWMTFNQAKKIGYGVKKGEESIPVCYWKLHKQYYDETTDKWIDYKNSEDVPEGAKKRSYMKLEKVISVFNVKQLADYDGNPFPAMSASRSEITLDEDLCELADKLIESSRCPVKEGEGISQAAYSPAHDVVKMPDRRDFTSMNGFITTLTHEMTHSTMKPFNRHGCEKGLAFASKEYAFEELIAELGSTFTCVELGVHRLAELQADENFENHAAYLRSWLKEFEEDPQYLFDAMNYADKAADYLMDRYDPEWREAQVKNRVEEYTRLATPLYPNPDQMNRISDGVYTWRKGPCYVELTQRGEQWACEIRMPTEKNPIKTMTLSDSIESAYVDGYNTMAEKLGSLRVSGAAELESYASLDEFIATSGAVAFNDQTRHADNAAPAPNVAVPLSSLPAPSRAKAL